MKTFAKILGVTVGLLLLISIIVALSGSTVTKVPTATGSAPIAAVQTTAVAPKPTGPAISVSDGSYQVGVDIAAGRFKTSGPDANDIIPSCYWARSSNDSGAVASIIANDIVSGPGVFTVKSGEFLKLTGSCVWTLQ